MKILPIASIHASPHRQRKEFKANELRALEDSIARNGLIHPLVIVEVSGTLHLVAGGRRLKAIANLYERDEPVVVRFDGEELPIGFVPTVSSISSAGLSRAEVEFDENAIRAELSWQERTAALLLIHELREAAAIRLGLPPPTDSAFARELAEKGGLSDGPKSPSGINRSIVQARAIQANISAPSVSGARNVAEAYTAALAVQQRVAHAALRRKTAISNPTIITRHGNALEIMATMDSDQFDAIISDPPYGLDADGAGFSARTVHHHTYTDDFETARSILQSIILEGMRLMKPRGIIFLFTDIEHFDFLRQAASQVGMVPFRTPLFWQKSLSEGMRPAGWGRGVARTYDCIFLARKGQRGLLEPISDIFFKQRVDRHSRTFAAEKPIDLMKSLVSAATLPGEAVFDPCMGSGSTLIAASQLKRKATGIEMDLNTYNLALSRLQEDDEEATNDIDTDTGNGESAGIDGGTTDIADLI